MPDHLWDDTLSPVASRTSRGRWVLFASVCLASCGLEREGLLGSEPGSGGGAAVGGAGGTAGSGGGWPDAGAGTGGTLPTGGGGSAGAPLDASAEDALGDGVVDADAGDAGDASDSPGPWKPLDIPNCVLWLDAADAATVSLSGPNAQAWTDKCAATPVTSAGNAKPVYVPALQNGLGALRFDGADDHMEVGGTPKVAAALVLFTVCVHRSPTLPAAPIWSNRHIPATLGATPTYLGLSSQRPFLYQNIAPQPSLLGTTALGTSPHLLELSIGPSGRQLVVDGVLDTADAAVSNTPTILPSGILAADQPNGWYGAVDLFEVVAYDRELTGPERSAVRAALKAKWALP